MVILKSGMFKLSRAHIGLMVILIFGTQNAEKFQLSLGFLYHIYKITSWVRAKRESVYAN